MLGILRRHEIYEEGYQKKDRHHEQCAQWEHTGDGEEEVVSSG